MKKLIVLVSLLFLLTGCDATYNLVITDKNIEETLQFVETNTSLWNSTREYGLVYSTQIDNAYEWPTGSFYDKQTPEYEAKKVEGFEYYDISKISSSNELGLRYNYIFNYYDYINSSILRTCYSHVSAYNEGNTYVITTSKTFNCFNYYDMLENVTINVTTNLEVTSHNADSVNENTYSWSINKNNYQNKLIFIKYKQKQLTIVDDNADQSEDTKSFWQKNWFVLLGIVVIISIIVIFIYSFINKKNKLNNTL